MSQQQPVGDCWLWPEGNGVRWWTPEETGVMKVAGPGRDGGAVMRPPLRDRKHARPLASGLAPPLAALVRRLLYREIGGFRLQLDEALPPVWHESAYHWLRHDNRSLHGRMLAIRRVPAVTGAVSPIRGRVVMLDLWNYDAGGAPGTDLFADLSVPDGVQVVRGRGPAESMLRTADISAYSMLCVVAHGSERNDVPPIRLSGGGLWALPEDAALPPIVVLLVCGNDECNLLRYGVTLLARGARAVLAPAGRLDAAAADSFLRKFIAAWSTGRRLDEILLALQAGAGSDLCARRLLLIGEGGLRVAEDLPIDLQPDEQLARSVAAGDGVAFAELLRRITFRAFRRTGRAQDADGDLRRALSVPFGDEQKEPWLLSMLDRVQGQLPTLTRQWVVPFAAFLASAYEHRLLAKYERIRHRLDARLPDVSVAAHHYYWAKLYYREGKYKLDVREVATGLNRLTGRNREPESLALLGHLLDVMLEMRFPHEAERLLRFIDRRLDHADTAEAMRHRLNLLDRTARLRFIEGRYDRALGAFERKRADSMALGESGERELAWLLYAGAWSGARQTAGHARAAKEIVARAAASDAEPSFGNDDLHYLARALALWCWRADDGEAAALLRTAARSWLPPLDHGDPGAAGFTCAFLTLHHRVHKPEDASWLPPWGAVQEKLETRRYWLELAGLNLLLGEQAEGRRCLLEFGKQRRDVLRALGAVPRWVGRLDWKQRAATRMRETRGLLSRASVRKEEPMPAWLFPM